MTYKQRATVPVLDRIMARVDRSGDCWVYTGGLTKNGYATINLGRVGEGTDYVHRVSYRAAKGPIPVGMDLDHLCRNRACCNPEHLEPVTRQVNLLRGVGPTATNAAKTHCKRGHEFTDENTRFDGRGRQCRTCDAIRRGRRSAA